MQVFETKKGLIHFLEKERIKEKKIGFVPTMGALHQGHLALIQKAKEENDLCVCSIFVNPTQFNNKEDLERYPRSAGEDLRLLKQAGCQAAFLPAINELYDKPFELKTTLHFGEIETILEGKYRPGHFSGVGLVVTKLFNIVSPDRTYFGQKDLQQYHLIRQLILDLSFDIQLRCVPTERESDGLALSSRNQRIPPESRPQANKFYLCLLHCKSLLEQGENPEKLQSIAETFLSPFEALRLEYIELVDTENFRIIHRVLDNNRMALCIAGYINNIRVIDNVMFN
jgi:pantoate--beta-alanine ligase